jgi:hypothetical protein
MKRLWLDGALILRMKGRTLDFRGRTAYEVTDEVAAHPYLSKHIVKIEDIAKAEKKTRRTRVKKEAE